MFKKFILICLCFISSLTFANGINPFLSKNSFYNEATKELPAKEAFPVEINKLKNNEVELLFEIKPDYYLYKDKIKLEINGKKETLRLPEGELKEDPFFGKTTVLKYGFSTIIKPNENTEYYNIDLQYQGCSAKYNVCYLPENVNSKIKNDSYDPNKKEIKNNNELVKNNDLSLKDTIKGISTTNNTNMVVDYLKNNKNNPIIYIVFFGIGILVAFTPCIYPMMPIIVASTTKAKNVKLASFSYILGMVFCYAILGLITGFLNFNIQIAIQNQYFIYIISGFLFFLAMFMFGFVNILLPNGLNEKITNKINEIDPSNYKNQFVIGFLSSLVLSPCSIAPLLGVLIFINQVNEPIFGTLLLSIMGLGIGFPLFLLSTSFSKFMPRNGAWMNEVKNVIGLIILMVVFYLLKRYIDELYIYIMILITFLTYGFYLLNLNKKQIIGGLIIIFSVITFNYLINNLNSNIETKIKNDIKLKYTEILNSKNLNENIINSNKPIFIDYYADWCVTCVRMNKTVLSNEDIINYLNNNYNVLKVNLTDLTPSKKEIMKENNILAIPYYVFINKDGEKEIFTGELDETEFLNLLKIHNED